ncbi:TPA: autotransporter outer membrane beta-barrel domain-containing protein [Escherichia coli]|uniref:autotransporter outer membrane beta-barrel domain-containing protein n=1 Tax=Escherichia TaxID=561 RepID=UPI001887DB9D|nr:MULTISPECIES: autotransporter outer membrane beta-barrel domain-containing protein [Escherichia]
MKYCNSAGLNYYSGRLTTIATLIALCITDTVNATTINAGTTITVDGVGALPQWNMTDSLLVNGTLNILNGGLVSNNDSRIGDSVGSIGTVEVTGPGSSWSSTSGISVGYDGEGYLTISDGATVSSTSLFNFNYIGDRVGSNGTVDVTGTGSRWELGNLSVGNKGKGNFTISEGAIVNTEIGTVGHKVGSTGMAKVTGTGTSWNSLYIYVGHGGEGHLTISDGATVNNSFSSIGHLEGATGVVEVTGENSKWNSSSGVTVGFLGNGSLNISNGGAVVSSSSDFSTIGYDVTSVSTANVTGAGSSWAGWKFQIGNKGKGSLTISDDAIVSARDVAIGVSAGSTGVLNIGAEQGLSPVAAGQLIADTVSFGAGTGVLTLNHTSTDFTLDANIRGAGTVNALSGTSALTGDNSAYRGYFNINAPAILEINSQKNIGTNDVVLSGGTLAINSAQDWRFINKLNGNGTLSVNTDGNRFDFDSSSLTGNFSGTLSLKNTLLNLTGTNTDALQNVLLKPGSGSVVVVGDGQHTIGGLAFDGGKLISGTITPGHTSTNNTLHTTGQLDISGSGTVQVTTADSVNNDAPGIDSSIPLLGQDDGNIHVQLISTDGSVTGNGGNLKLTDQNGKIISDGGTTADISQGDNLVARGTWDYRLTSGANNDGLYIGYGLTQLELLTSGADALVLDANGKTGNAADMSARITGTGDLAFNSQKGETVSLSNQNNDYTGVTDIRGGNILMNSNSALGQTSEIRLAADTQLDMNGHSQTAGKLNGAAGSILNINGGNLTLAEGGVSAGTLTGNGVLNVNSGVLDITGASSSLTVSTTIAEKATVNVYNSDGLGTGLVDTAGALILGRANAPVMLASNQVNIAKDGILTGFGGVSGNVTNSGTFDLRADAPGNVLTVGGNYTGNNGTLLMNTVLGDDTSATDKLVIKGDASGQTRVAVTNAGGTGAQTLNGIELIHVDGNADSAEFVQAGRIAAGAYDYTLGRGQGSNSGNWYLTSGKNTPDPEPTPTPDPGGYDNDLRPEAGSYTANMAAANTMFVTRLHDRLGPVQYTDVMTGETKNTSMWMRHEGGHNRWRDGTGQLKTQGNRYVVQLGGDIAQWGWGETDRWHLGVMAGYGNDHNNTDSVRTGYRSKGSVNGYSTGLYATWFANDETHNGAYLDTWAQYGWFDNHVKGDGLPGESWKSKGLTASLETGYTWKAGEFSGSHDSLNEWYVQPQAQVVWMGVKADEHRESNGTRVESTGDGNVRTRLGVKTWIKGHNRMDDGKSREFRPFVEVNWLHNTRDFGTRMNGVTVHQDGAHNIGEVKAGVEGQINDRLNLWGNVGVQAGDKGYSDTSAMLGVKYTF